MKKTVRIIAFALCLALSVALAPASFAADAHWDWDTDGHYDVSWYSREGKSYTLTTAEQLAGLAWIVNQGNLLKLPGEKEPLRESFTGKTIKLGADIYLNDSAYTDVNEAAHQWPSIGGGIHTEENAVFNGTFDGQGHTVWNMYIHNLTVWTEYDARNRGFFGITAEQAIIENLTVRNGYVRTARSTGGIVGKTGYLNEDPNNPQHGYDSSLSGHGTIIRNCHNVNTTVITTDSKGVGGIVGAGWNYAIIQNCSNSGTISNIGKFPAGGIAGENEYLIENCVNTGTVSSAMNNAGGIVGSNKLAISEIRGCYNTGKITGEYAGGLAGYHLGLTSDGYNAGTVSGKNAGGLFGEFKSGQANENLYYLTGGKAAGLVSYGEPNATAVSAAELQSADMASKLGSAYIAGKSGVNSGYPTFTWQKITVADIADNAWYAGAAKYVVDAGLFDVSADGRFSPDAPMTRAMLVTALTRLGGDASKITDGTNPQGTITREQIATMMHRFAGLPVESADLSSFPDGGEVSDWARDAMAWAVANKIINGSDGKLLPQGTATRAQVAQILLNYAG